MRTSTRILNWQEYVANTDPRNGSDYLSLNATRQSATGIVVRFPTQDPARLLRVVRERALRGTSWTLATTNGLAGTGGMYEWVDNGTQTTSSSVEPVEHQPFLPDPGGFAEVRGESGDLKPGT